MHSVISRQDQAEKRITEVEDKIEKILQSVIKKEINKKKRKTGYNLQEPWDTIKRPNLRLHGVDKDLDIQIKGTGKPIQ
jgi:hypothetical protein